MTWPTSPVDTAALDSALDDPSLARAALKEALDKLNQMIGAQPGLLGVRVYDAAGTYTYNATAGTKSIIIELLGAQGGNTFKPSTTSTQRGISFPGSRGQYAKARFTSGFDGKTLVIGAGGAGGTPTGSGFTYTQGKVGGDSSFGGAMLVCKGGAGALGHETSVYPSGDTVQYLPAYDTNAAPSTSGQLLAWARPAHAGLILLGGVMQPTSPIESAALPLPGNLGCLPEPELIFPSSAAANGRAGLNGTAVIYEFG